MELAIFTAGSPPLFAHPSLPHSLLPSFIHSLTLHKNLPPHAGAVIPPCNLLDHARLSNSSLIRLLTSHPNTPAKPDHNPRHPVTKRNTFCDPRPRRNGLYSPNKLTFVSPNAGNHTGDKKSVVGSRVSGRAVNKNKSAI